MQGVQKLKCTSCGVMFMSETDSKTCPSCSGDHSHGHEGMGGCGCGHSHWSFLIILSVFDSKRYNGGIAFNYLDGNRQENCVVAISW